MSADKPSLPKGTRDFGPEQMARRHFIFGRIREVFERYGFQPLETPAMENLSVLTGKYGDEGDQLLYKVLDSGDFLAGAEDADWRGGYRRLLPKIAGKGLRYDLTVPFARYVVMNRPNLTFPFRRYQIQPVWRADRPQKGRYREFYQCDADVVGTDSLLCEAECLLMIRDVFALLGIGDYEIRINSRRILSALARRVGMPGRETAFCTALDKLDKTGREALYADLEREGCKPEDLAALTPLLELRGGTGEKLAAFEGMDGQTEEGLRGVREIREILSLAGSMNLDLSRVVFDLSLARGLNYYTGAILELKATRGSLKSSLGGGGRYDNLTGVFGLEGVPGVGFSFGVDRIYDLMEELDLFPAQTGNAVTLLVAHLDAESFVHGLGLLASLRAEGIRAEIYPEPARLKKQLAYADRKGIPFTLMVGPQEIAENRYALRNMGTSAQQLLPGDGIAPALRAEMSAIITGA
jgi:histidyl-tRNA synthetase